LAVSASAWAPPLMPRGSHHYARARVRAAVKTLALLARKSDAG